MNAFQKLRFPKLSLVLFIVAALVVIAFPVRYMLGAAFALPADNVVPEKIILPILIIGVASLLLALLIWLPLRKKNIRFFELFYPVSILAAIVMLAYLHIILFV